MRLGDVCDVVGGATPKTSEPAFWDGDIKWATPAEIGDETHVLTDTVKHLTKAGYESASLHMMPAGTVLLTTRAPIGKVALAGSEMCCNQGFKCLVCSDSVNNEWLYRYLKHRSSQLQSMGTGATFKELSKRAVSDLQVVLPPMQAQLDVAANLNAVERVIHLVDAELSKLDELVKSRFVEMFGDPKTNSCGWPVKQLGQISDTRLGKMLDKKKQTGSHLFPYLANTNVQWFRFELGNLNQMDFDESDQSEFELRDGDVLATEGGEVGRSAIWHNQLEHCYFQKAVHRIRCHKDCLLPEYLVWAFKMKSELGLFYPYTSKSTIAHLTGKKIKQVPLQLPPLALQCEFADFATRVDKLRFMPLVTVPDNRRIEGGRLL